MSYLKYGRTLVTPIMISLMIALLILGSLALASVHAGQDPSGVWYFEGLGVEVIYLPGETETAIWLYIADRLIWRLRSKRLRLPSTGEVDEPSPTPMPTPNPVRRRPMELKQV